MIIIAGHLRVAPAERAHYLTVVGDVAVQAREAPGCLDFVQSADPIDPARINIYERWDSDEALMVFRTSGGEEAEDGPRTPAILGADVAKYRISAVESP
jgi:quinol monooxygenase YgiN